MIDFELEIKNIQPISMKEMELNQYRIDNNIRKSITLYNKSIAEIKTKDFDLAIKDLKKALSYNKGFSEAIKLLGLCYANKKEYKKAEKVFLSMVKNDIYTDLSKEYIKDLIIEKNMLEAMNNIKIVNSSINNTKGQAIPNRHLRKRIIIGLSIIIIGILGVSITYWIQGKLQNTSKEIESINIVENPKIEVDENSEQNKDLAEKTTKLHEEYTNIQKELNNTKSELDSTKLELDTYKNKYDILLMLNEVEKLLENGSYEEGAIKLINVKNLNLDNEAKVKFDKLWSDLRAKGLWTIYNQGSKLYKKRSYKEALPKLKIASEIDPNLDIMPWITYQIGTCYKEINDNANALVFFKKVKDSYPQSQYAASAQRHIDQIEN